MTKSLYFLWFCCHRTVCMTPKMLFQLVSSIFWFHPLQPPHLVNSVLLRELKLDDNSISSLEPLSKAWLPLLQTLSVSQNRLELQNVNTPLNCGAYGRLRSLKNYIQWNPDFSNRGGEIWFEKLDN